MQSGDYLHGSLLAIAGPSYPLAPLPRTHTPPEVYGDDGYAKYRSCLRLDFGFRCTYCLAHESEIGPSSNYGGFEVEHFKPKGKKGNKVFWSLRNEYANLLWACDSCNRAKSNRWPSPEEIRAGFVFVDPSLEGWGHYVTLTGVLLVPTSHPARKAAATYIIEEIDLNSPAHQERRRRRQAVVTQLATLQAVVQVQLADTDTSDTKRANLDAVLRSINELSHELFPPDPWDAPHSCYCG